MRSVSVTEAKQRLADLLDAVQSGPIVIRRQKRDAAVLLSPQEYDRLRGINVGEFQEFCDRVAAKAPARGPTQKKR